jgi:hypothetical protein
MSSGLKCACAAGEWNFKIIKDGSANKVAAGVIMTHHIIQKVHPCKFLNLRSRLTKLD